MAERFSCHFPFSPNIGASEAEKKYCNMFHEDKREAPRVVLKMQEHRCMGPLNKA